MSKLVTLNDLERVTTADQRYFSAVAKLLVTPAVITTRKPTLMCRSRLEVETYKRLVLVSVDEFSVSSLTSRASCPSLSCSTSQ